MGTEQQHPLDTITFFFFFFPVVYELETVLLQCIFSFIGIVYLAQPLKLRDQKWTFVLMIRRR